jgi:hypothetical protein
MALESCAVLGYYRPMKQLSAFFMVITLLAVSILPSAPCEDAANGVPCGNMAVSTDIAGEHDGDTQSAQCDQCAGCHHHGSQGMVHASVDVVPAVAASPHVMAHGQTDLSQLHYLPSRPPKA